jgi:hypothetical protein
MCTITVIEAVLATPSPEHPWSATKTRRKTPSVYLQDAILRRRRVVYSLLIEISWVLDIEICI